MVGFRCTKSCKLVTERHTTLHTFYLKDLAWLHLRVVILGKKKGVGAQPLQPSLPEPNQLRISGKVKFPLFSFKCILLYR